MSGPKRPAHDTFGSSQLVKRTKPDANGGSNAVTVVNGAGQNGALIRAVCTTHDAGEVRSLKLQCADRRPRAAAARCRVQSWNSLAILGRSSHVDSIRPASTLPLGQWTARYVSHVPKINWWFALTSYSTLAQLRRLRKLWHSHRTQAGGTRSTLVARLESAVLGVCGHAPGELGCGDGREDTQASWSRGGDQLHGREQAR
jgi:hypothetical protein